MNLKLAYRLVVLGLVIYVIGFVLYYPKVFASMDASVYVNQAWAYAQGKVTVSVKDALSDIERQVLPGTYPAGTPLLQAPFVFFGGERYAVLASVMSLAIAILILARWLREEGRSPIYALLMLGYAPTLVMARCELSDLPSAMLVTLGLWLFWRGQSRHWSYWLASGFVAGTSLLFRETNALLFIPFFTGALLRREKNAFILVVGGLFGVILRLLVTYLIFSDPFFLKNPGFGFSLGAVIQNGPLYLFALLVMIPGGLIAALLYQGPRRPELIITVIVSLLFFLLYNNSGQDSGGLKRMVNGPRYFIPLLPILIMAYSEVLPRLWSKLTAHYSNRATTAISMVAKVCITLWVGLVFLASFAVHPFMQRWAASQSAMKQAIYANTAENGVIVSDPDGKINKFVNRFYGKRLVVTQDDLKPEDIPLVLKFHRHIQLVFINRSDSEFHLKRAIGNEEFVAAVNKYCRVKLIYDKAHSPTDRLKIWDIKALAQSVGNNDE